MNVVSFNDDLVFGETNVKTKLVIETAFSKEIRILLKEGQSMKEHKAPYPILIHVLEGKIDLGVDGVNHEMSIGQIITLDSNVPHDLSAKADTIVRLTLSKLDKIERVREVVEG